jgi:hypothetical protein
MEAQNIHKFPGFIKGKRKPSDRASVPFGDFLVQLPTAPLIDQAPQFNYPMDGNDRVACCVVAGYDHFRQVVTGLLTGTQQNFTQDQIWAFYKTQNLGFDPNGTASTNGPGSSSDNGMCIQTFLQYLVSQKLILGFAKIDHTNEQEMKAAIYLGLSIITGVVLDEVQMQQFSNKIWDYVPGGAVDGGHCIPLVGYVNNPDEQTCVTWGSLVNCTQSFINNQMDEAWFVLTQDHVNHPNFRNFFDLAGFSKAVSEITQGQIVIPVPTMPTYSQSFINASNNTLGWEGGYTTDPNDPGGETNFGISKRSYPNVDIKNLTQVQAVQIYYNDFWVHIHGDSMPKGLAMNVFDAAINMGLGAGIKLMQSALGVVSDGVIGPHTLAAMQGATNDQVTKFVILRCEAYTKLSQFALYGNTWLTRTIGTLTKSLIS